MSSSRSVENGLILRRAQCDGFDIENCIVSVRVTGQTTQFVYDGDGNLVKKIKPDGNKTLYIGGLYEVDKTPGGALKRTVTYYPAGGAMRINISGGSNTLYFTLKDHLGSASVATDSTGAIVSGSEQRYYPYGESRLTGTMLTDQLFTGQRDVGLGIYHYGARFYSPKLGRFLSPDTIVPGAGNPQAWNRYSYVLGNPLKYTDPTGHGQCQTQEDCEDMGTTPMGTGASHNNKPKPKTKDKGNGGNHCNSNPSCKIASDGDNYDWGNGYNTPDMPGRCDRPHCYDERGYGVNSPGFPVSWDSSSVPWDEVALDAVGLLGDMIPVLQLPATILEGVKVVNHGLDVAEIGVDSYDILSSDDLHQIDWINVGLDVASLSPTFGSIPSAIGLIYNLSQGIVIDD